MWSRSFIKVELWRTSTVLRGRLKYIIKYSKTWRPTRDSSGSWFYQVPITTCETKQDVMGDQGRPHSWRKYLDKPQSFWGNLLWTSSTKVELSGNEHQDLIDSLPTAEQYGGGSIIIYPIIMCWSAQIHVDWLCSRVMRERESLYLTHHSVIESVLTGLPLHTCPLNAALQ